MWTPTTDLPPIGVRIIALYNDGSGAVLFTVAGENEMMDDEGDIIDVDLAEDFSHWALAPEGYTFFFERADSDGELEPAVA